MPPRKRWFDEKFSREFVIKPPFFVGLISLIFIKYYISDTCRKSLKSAKIRIKRMLMKKIAATSAENCQFRGQKMILTAERHGRVTTASYDILKRLIYVRK